eukprot:COSAG01_NODE_6423_length_3674_cov_26.761399_6_plen_43_part_00
MNVLPRCKITLRVLLTHAISGVCLGIHHPLYGVNARVAACGL